MQMQPDTINQVNRLDRVGHIQNRLSILQDKRFGIGGPENDLESRTERELKSET